MRNLKLAILNLHGPENYRDPTSDTMYNNSVAAL